MDIKRTLRRAYAHLFSPYDYSTHVLALHEYRAIYIAVPKVANTSVKAALSTLLPPDITPETAGALSTRALYGRNRDTLFRRNIRLYKHQIPRYSDYFVFTFVRDPWERLISCYRDKIERGSVMEDGQRTDPSTRRLYLGREFERDMSFEEFVYKVARIPDRRANRHFRSQYTFVMDRRGRLLPDFVGRFENLSGDFDAVMGRIGANHVSLPHVRRSSGEDHSRYYTAELARIVADRYARDVEVFGYSFPEELR